jgi:hypothetical protein
MRVPFPPTSMPVFVVGSVLDDSHSNRDEMDQEVEKSSGRNKPMWLAIHKYMEATLGISLCSYLYPKPANFIS